MRKIVALAVLAISLALGTARASVIENGIYYSSAEPGRGYSIEQQGGQMTLIFYVYETSGAPVWYYASGGYTMNAAGYPTMTATLGRYTGGQCLGCSFTNPTGSNIGTVTVTFANARRATLTLGSSSGAFGSGGGSSISLERFGFSDAANPLLGQWMVSYSIAAAGGGNFGNTFGDYMRFTTVGSPANTGSTGLVTGSVSGYAGECFTSGSLSGSCLVSFSSGSFLSWHVIAPPLNEWRGYYSISTSSSRFRSQGLRVAMPGESSVSGIGTANDAAVDGDAVQAGISARVAAFKKQPETNPLPALDAAVITEMARAQQAKR